MNAVPPDTPVTIPLKDPTVAIPGAPELHVPPEDVSVKVAGTPAQMTALPDIGAGNGSTVTEAVTKHPAPSE